MVSCLIFFSESPIPTSSLAGDQFWKTWVFLIPHHHHHLYSIFYPPYLPLHPLLLQQHFFFFFTWCLISLSLSLPQDMYHVSHIVSTDAHQTCSDLKLGTLSLFHLEIKWFSFSHCLKVYEKIKMSKSTRSQYISLLNLFFFS